MKPKSIVQTIQMTTTILISIFLAACSSATTPIPDLVVTSVPTTASTPSGHTVRVGVLINRSAEIALKEWGPLMTNLSQSLGRTFQTVPLNFDEILPAVENKTVDFVMTNSLQGVQARRLYNVEFVATLASAKTGTEFSGLIIVRSDSNIYTLEDLKGKRVNVVSIASSLGGYAMQAYHLQQNGIDPVNDPAAVIEMNSHDNVILAVLNGTSDVGFIRTGHLEKMVSEGVLTDLSEIRVLDPMQDDFPYTHTTRLYPEWAFFAIADTDPNLIQQVQTTLLAIPAGDPSIASAKVDHFVLPVDYSAVEEVIKSLQLPSWDVNP